MNVPRPPGWRESRLRTPLVVRIARVVVAIVVLSVCAVVVSWWAIGGRWFIVKTASMGTYAPVGTMLWVKPTQIGDVHVGDVVSFHTPPLDGVYGERVVHDPSQIYTHRVVAVDRDGTLQTKGDLNAGRDPWHIDQSHLIGRVAIAMPGVGWLVKAFPILLPGIVAWWVLTSLFASRRSKAPLRVIGTAALLAVALYVYNPLFGATQLSFVPTTSHAAEATYVGTGLMPVKLMAKDVPSVLVHTGQLRSIVATHVSLHGRYRVQVLPVIPWQTWAIIVAGALAPAIWSVIAGVDPPPPPSSRRKQRSRESAPAAPRLQPS